MTPFKFTRPKIRLTAVIGFLATALVHGAHASCPSTGTVASSCTDLNWSSGDVTINTGVAVTSTSNNPIIVTGGGLIRYAY